MFDFEASRPVGTDSNNRNLRQGKARPIPDSYMESSSVVVGRLRSGDIEWYGRIRL